MHVNNFLEFFVYRTVCKIDKFLSLLGNTQLIGLDNKYLAFQTIPELLRRKKLFLLRFATDKNLICSVLSVNVMRKLVYCLLLVVSDFSEELEGYIDQNVVQL